MNRVEVTDRTVKGSNDAAGDMVQLVPHWRYIRAKMRFVLLEWLWPHWALRLPFNFRHGQTDTNRTSNVPALRALAARRGVMTTVNP